jgi:signal peptidase I
VTRLPDHETTPEPGPVPLGAPLGRAARPVRRRGRSRAPLPIWQEVLLLLAIALVLAIVVKAFLLQAFYIPSASMNDTLVKNDRILVEKVSSWGGGGPHRGDVVVFADPGGWLGATESQPDRNPVARALEVLGLFPAGGHLVKRVIGVGGDEVRCCDARGRVTVNGVALHEQSYLTSGDRPSTIDFDVKVSKGYVWVQGDNRSDSADSRVHLGDPGGGQVPVDDVVGRAFAVVWPPSHAKTLPTPATFGSVR